jgi:hypothetical protein
MKRPKFLKETYVSNFFVIVIISLLFLYSLAAYHWKGLKKIYNFVVGNISIKIHMQKLWLIFFNQTFIPKDNLNSFSLMDMIVPWGKIKFLSVTTKTPFP